MKILVIGSAGFIGQFLVKKLVENNHQVNGLDVNPHPEEIDKICTCHTGDLLSKEDLTNAAEGVDMVISLAAKHHDFGVSREEFFRVNEDGTQLLLDVAQNLNITKLIFYSTVAVYGTRKEPSTEEMMPLPDSNYGESKLAGEKRIYAWCNADKKRNVIIVRPTVIYGPNNYANVYNLIDKIYRKKFLFVGDGKNIKSVAYVENLVDATLYLLDKFKSGYQIFNYSDEPQMTISEIVDIIYNNMPFEAAKMKLPLWLAMSFGGIFDALGKLTGHNYPITAARMKKFATATYHQAEKIRHLGFKQRFETKDGFRRTIDWYIKSQTN